MSVRWEVQYLALAMIAGFVSLNLTLVGILVHDTLGIGLAVAALFAPAIMALIDWRHSRDETSGVEEISEL